MKTYTNKDIQLITGMTHRQIIYATKQMLGEAEVQSASGRGSIRIYSNWDLYRLYLVKVLKDSGLEYAAIKPIMTAVDHYYKDIRLVVKNLMLHVFDAKYAYIGSDNYDTWERAIDLTTGRRTPKKIYPVMDRKRPTQSLKKYDIFPTVHIQVDLLQLSTRLGVEKDRVYSAQVRQPKRMVSVQS